MKKILFAILLSCLVFAAKAQSFKLQTNVAGWLAKTANIGGGLVINDYSSIDFNFYSTIGESWIRDADFMGLQIDYRFWLAKQPLEDFFVGITFMPLKFDNFRVNSDNFTSNHKEGSMIMGGLNFGYCWMLSPRWSLDVVYGVGLAYIYYQDESLADIHDGHTYFREHERFRLVPANFGVNLSYILR